MILDTLTTHFNNRELATGMWLIIASIALSFFVYKTSKRRGSIWAILKSLFKLYVIVPIILMCLYIGLVVFGLYSINIWGFADHLKDTIIWSITIGFVMFINFPKASQVGFYRNTIKDTFKLSIILEFVIGLYPFSFATEFLVLIPITTFLLILQTFSNATRKDETQNPLDKVINVLLSLIGVWVLWHSFMSLSGGLNKFFTLDTIFGFSLPILLTIAFLPFIYLISAYGTYQSLLGSFKAQNTKEKRKLARHAIWRLFRRFGFNSQAVKKWEQENRRLWFKDKQHLLEIVSKK